MATISLNMILGQKIEPYLQYALESTKWLDEHVIVNTGEDNNPNLAVVEKVLPKAKIIKFSGEFNFSAARNLALQNSEGQWILWQDADEVHFDMLEGLSRGIINSFSGDGISTAFYHFILDVYHYQSIDERVNIFRREGKEWEGKVHERVKNLREIYYSGYRYHHYGYTKPQKDIYENWRLYWSLNEHEQFKLHENRDPNNIITDRVTVANTYFGEYPEVIRDYISQQHSLVKDYKLINPT